MPLAKWLNYTPTNIYPMYPDTELDFGDVKIRALYGRHTNLGQGFNDLCDRIENNDICKNDPGIAALQAIGSMEYRNYLFTLPKLLLFFKLYIFRSFPSASKKDICCKYQFGNICRGKSQVHTVDSYFIRQYGKQNVGIYYI